MALRVLLLAALPIALVPTLACDDASPAAPTAALSTDTGAAPTTATTVCGLVRTFYSIADEVAVAAVTVSASSTLGSFSTTSDADGSFCVPAAGEAQLQFAKQGFTTVTLQSHGGTAISW